MAETGFAPRVSTPEDFAAVGALLRASYPRLMSSAYDASVLVPALEFMARPNPTLLACGTFYVIESNGLVVGCGGWTREHPGTHAIEEGLAHLRHFATHPVWTKRGIGRAIYERCESEARGAGIRAFECHSSVNGESFYAALGFERIGPMRIPMGSMHVPAVLMRRAI